MDIGVISLLILVVIFILLIRRFTDDSNIFKDAKLTSHPEKTIKKAFEDAFGCKGDWTLYNENDTDYVMYTNLTTKKEICIIFKITDTWDVIVNKLYIDSMDYGSAVTDFLDLVYYDPKYFTR